MRAPLAVGVHCLRTMMNEWDAYGVDEATAARTIFVDNGGLTATQFDLTPDQQNMLFVNGVARPPSSSSRWPKPEGCPVRRSSLGTASAGVLEQPGPEAGQHSARLRGGPSA